MAGRLGRAYHRGCSNRNLRSKLLGPRSSCGGGREALGEPLSTADREHRGVRGNGARCSEGMMEERCSEQQRGSDLFELFSTANVQLDTALLLGARRSDLERDTRTGDLPDLPSRLIIGDAKHANQNECILFQIEISVPAEACVHSSPCCSRELLQSKQGKLGR